ncbi:MAG TPA: metal-dependent hydrolase [Candidatus Limnocylindrales bacterium]|nr:metal-dependent hydrolase [Candidatus Limnocylindrales bacterium]
MSIGRDVSFIWYGHSAWETRTPGGRRIVFDPFLQNPRSPKRAADLEACDLLLVSHGHFDHFGDALEIARRFSPAWPCIHEMSLWVASQWAEGGDRVIGMNAGGTVEAAGIRVTMVPAVHSGSDTTPASGGETADVPIYLGEPVGFVVELENGFLFYYAGDTTLFGDMRLISELYRPELAFLPIGGHFTMGPREAAYAVELLGVKRVAPMHYGTFPILAGTPVELRHELARRGLRDVEVLAVEPGGTID